MELLKEIYNTNDVEVQVGAASTKAATGNVPLNKYVISVRGNVRKKTSIFTDIIQIEVDPPPSYPIFDKFIFDTVLIMLTSLPPLEFLTKIMKF